MVPGLYGTTLELVWGAGKYSEGLVSESSYQGRSIGLLSDRTLHSEPAPGIITARMWKYHTNENVSASAIGLNTHYTDKKNRFEYYESQDDKKTFDYMPSFLILPKELVSWFLDKEPTPFEFLKMIWDDLLQGGAVPEELELATAWLINCCSKVTNRDTPPQRSGSPRRTTSARSGSKSGSTVCWDQAKRTPGRPNRA